MGEKPYFFTPESSSQEIVPLKDIVRSENFVIDRRSEANYAANLFDVNALRKANLFNPDKPIDAPENQGFLTLDREFRAEYEQAQTIQEHFGLFIDKRYFPYLNSLDLGKTREAHNLAKLVELQNQYRILRNGLIEDGCIEGELPRETSGREIHFRPDALVYQGDDAALQVIPIRAVGVRNRPLIHFEHNGFDVCVIKRMTFIVPVEMSRYLTQQHDEDFSFTHEDTKSIVLPDRMAMMERLLDTKDPRITPVRTLYYARKSEIRN